MTNLSFASCANICFATFKNHSGDSHPVDHRFLGAPFEQHTVACTVGCSSGSGIHLVLMIFCAGISIAPIWPAPTAQTTLVRRYNRFPLSKRMPSLRQVLEIPGNSVSYERLIALLSKG